MIDTVFNTHIYSVKLDQHEKFKKDFEPYINDSKFWADSARWNCNVKTTMDSQKNNELPWDGLIQAIGTEVEKYVYEVFEPYREFNLLISQWMCRYDKGDYQEQHNHIGQYGSQLSCSYFLQIPPDSGKFAFSCPAQDFYGMTGFYDFCQKVPQRIHYPEQEEGTLLIFPSFLDHFVTANNTNRVRSTISMNFKFIPKDMSNGPQMPGQSQQPW